MVQRPPDSEDPTTEEEAPEFDGAQTDQLDDTYRFRVVTASESGHGTVGFDDRGNSQWKWRAEIEPIGSDPNETFDQLKALENPALSLEDEAKPEQQPPTRAGYDPYATSVSAKPKVRR
jgi:hypothetical protein